MANTTFPKFFKKVENSINTSTRQALNKAASSTKSEFVRRASAAGIPSTRARQRAKVNKVNATNPTAELSIGTRVHFAAHDFNPGEKKVSTAVGPRYAATYKVKGQSKVQTSKGPFLVEGKNSGKKIIIQRVGDARYPTTTVLLDIFIRTVESIKKDLQQYMIDTFKKNITGQVSYNLNKGNKTE